MKKRFLAICLATLGYHLAFSPTAFSQSNNAQEKYWQEDNYYKSKYSNVEFSNVNGFLMLANSIRTYQNESQKKSSRSGNDLFNITSPWDFSNLYSSTISTINTTKYKSYKIVDWLNSVEKDINEISAASYFYRYKNGKIEKDTRYTGVSAKGDSIMKVALPMLEEFANVIRYDNNIAELAPHITEYLKWTDRVTNEQFNWLNNKTKNKYGYITAKVSPFDFRSTIRTYKNTKKSANTLLQTGCGMVYDSWRCHANVKSEYPFFQSMASSIITSYINKGENFTEFLSASLFLMYCKEKGGIDLYQVELESRLCAFNEQGTKYNGISFIEFHEEFAKVYNEKGNKNKMDILCNKMANFCKSTKKAK